MFLGTYQHTLDPKGRVIVPSAFREGLQEGLVMTISQDRCVAVYPMDSWQVHLASMRQMRTTDARERQFVRMITAEAHPETLDRQGRITVPVRLRGYANLSKDVTVVGADTRIELWDSATWEPYREQGIADFAEINEAFNLGIL